MAYLKVEGYPNLRKDKVTGVIHNINKKEIEKFSRIAEEWWDPAGKF